MKAELLAKCQFLFPDWLSSLLVHLAITQAERTLHPAASEPLAQAALPSGFYRGNPDTLWGCQTRLIQPSERVLQLPAQLCTASRLLQAFPVTDPHWKNHLLANFPFPKESAAAAQWPLAHSLLLCFLPPSMGKLNTTHTRPIPA